MNVEALLDLEDDTNYSDTCVNVVGRLLTGMCGSHREKTTDVTRKS